MTYDPLQLLRSENEFNNNFFTLSPNIEYSEVIFFKLLNNVKY